MKVTLRQIVQFVGHSARGEHNPDGLTERSSCLGELKSVDRALEPNVSEDHRQLAAAPWRHRKAIFTLLTSTTSRQISSNTMALRSRTSRSSLQTTAR
jgi:hypothetical protein